MSVLGARLRSLREDRGWEPGQLAYKAGVSAAYVYKLENNERPNVSGVILARIAEILSALPADLQDRLAEAIIIQTEAAKAAFDARPGLDAERDDLREHRGGDRAASR